MKLYTMQCDGIFPSTVGTETCQNTESCSHTDPGKHNQDVMSCLVTLAHPSSYGIFIMNTA